MVGLVVVGPNTSSPFSLCSSSTSFGETLSGGTGYAVPDASFLMFHKNGRRIRGLRASRLGISFFDVWNIGVPSKNPSHLLCVEL